jgi:hypothetical protein
MASQSSISRPPVSSVLIEAATLVTRAWALWLEQVYRSLRTWTVSLSDQSAAIATTTIVTTRQPTPSGLFRVFWYAAIVTAAGVSSSLTVTIGFTDQGVAKTISGAAITGNTTATVQSGAVMIRVDQDTAVTYATAYASNAASAMHYALDVRVEALPVEQAIA